MRGNYSLQTNEPPHAAAWRERWIHFACALLILGALGVVHPAWFRFDRISTSGDMFCLFLPAHQFNREAWRAGNLPLWNPYNFCGTPFLAAMQTGCFYPLTAITVFAPDAASGIQIFRLLHVFLFALLIFCWLRGRYRLHPLAALTGALTAVCGAYVAGHQDHINQLAALAWLPAVFWAFQTLLDRAGPEFAGGILQPQFRLFNSLLQVGHGLFFFKRFRAGSNPAPGIAGLCRTLLLFALLLALQLLAGHPQNVFYTLLACLAYLLYWSGTRIAQRHGPAAIGSALAALAAGLALALGLSALQWIPAQELAARTYRVYDGFAYASAYAIDPAELPALFLPPLAAEHSTPNGEHGAYLGVLALLGVFAFFCVPAHWTRRNWLLLGAALLIVLISLGAHTFVFRIFYTLFAPLARHFRAPPRMLCLNLLICAFLLASLCDGAIRRLGRRGIFCGGIFCAAMLAEWTLYHREYSAFRPVKAAPVDDTWTLEKYLSAVDWYDLHSTYDDMLEHTAHYRLFRLMPEDPNYYTGTPHWLSGAVPVDSGSGAVEHTAQAGRSREELLRLRIRRNRVLPNLNVYAQIRTVEGYEEGLAPLFRFGDFLSYYNRNLRQDTPDLELLKLLGVKWVMFEFPVRFADYFAKVTDLQDSSFAAAQQQQQLAELQTARGWAQWLREIPPGLDLTRLDGPVQLSKGIFAPQIPLNRDPVEWPARDPARPWGLDPAEWDITPQTIRDAADTQQGKLCFMPLSSLAQPSVNRCAAEWKQPLAEAQWLWFSMASYPGWHARALVPPRNAAGNSEFEWRQTEMRAVNAIGSLVRCPVGATEVEMFYAPDSFRGGLFIALLSLLLCGGWLGWQMAARTENESAPRA